MMLMPMKTCRSAAVGDGGCSALMVGYVHEVLLVVPWDGILGVISFLSCRTESGKRMMKVKRTLGDTGLSEK